MRVQPHVVGSYMHVLKRGGRGMPIVKDEADQYRFIRSLYYLNDTFVDENWDRASYNISYSGQTTVTRKGKLFYRPEHWPRRKELVKILGYTLMPNHLHLLLKEVVEGGISLFMKKLGQSMTEHFNEKYVTRGSLFQGSYKGRTIDSDEYLRYVAAYIMVKNTFELFPGGIGKARENFEAAWQFSAKYPFSSFPDYVSERGSPIIDKEILGDLFSDKNEFKNFVRDVIDGGRWEKSHDPLAALVIE